MGVILDLIQQNNWDRLLALLAAATAPAHTKAGGAGGGHGAFLMREFYCKDRLGRTPLHYACAKKRAPAHVVGLMIDWILHLHNNKNRGNAATQSNTGNTSHLGRKSNLVGAPPSQHDICGNSLLHAAAACGNYSVVQVLLEKFSLYDITVRSLNDRGLSPIRMAWIKYLDSSFTMFGDPVRVSSSSSSSSILSNNNAKIAHLVHVQSRADLEPNLCDLWDKTLAIATDSFSKRPENMGASPLNANNHHSNNNASLVGPLHLLTMIGGDKDVQCPTIIMWLATKLHREELNRRDEEGNLPLHLAAMSEEWCIPTTAARQSSLSWTTAPNHDTTTTALYCFNHYKPALVILIEAWPQAARITNHHGRLPIHYAIENGKAFSNGIAQLHQAAPESLERRDPHTMLNPLLLAAASPKCELNTLFCLLRLSPHLLLWLESNSDMDFQTTTTWNDVEMCQV